MTYHLLPVTLPPRSHTQETFMWHRGHTRPIRPPALGCLALAAGLLLPAPGPAQVIVGQIDTFEKGTTLGWSQGTTNNLSIVTGGPGGASDHFLRMISDGAGTGGRLSMFNTAQWLGNYIAARVTAIAMDLRNFGTTPLTIRIAFMEG